MCACVSVSVSVSVWLCESVSILVIVCETTYVRKIANKSGTRIDWIAISITTDAHALQ